MEDENELPPFSPVFVEQLLHTSTHREPDTNNVVLPLLHLDPLSPTARRHSQAFHASHQSCVDLYKGTTGLTGSLEVEKDPAR